MSPQLSKIYNPLMYLTIVAFTLSLAWFAFGYYPKVIKKYQSGNVPTKPLVGPVSATNTTLPIETTAYRIIYEEKSNTYYAFVQGTILGAFTVNRDNAKLALKTALSTQDLCQFSVLYISSQGLKVPANLTENTDC